MDEVAGVSGSWGGLPDDDVADDGRGEDEVTADSSEVEGGDGEDETLESAVLGPVPDTGGVAGG